MTTTNTHTPGPWNYTFESTDPDWAVVTMKGGDVIANINGGDEANARLIAAAPDLLSAASDVLDAWEDGNLAEAVRSLSAAIQKATRSASCTCFLDAPCVGPVPHYCPEHDGDYSSFLACNNCD